MCEAADGGSWIFYTGIRKRCCYKCSVWVKEGSAKEPQITNHLDWSEHRAGRHHGVPTGSYFSAGP